MGTRHLHLVSDSTGETLTVVANASMVQFDSPEPVRHTWAMLRYKHQVEDALRGIEANPGLVLFTIVDPEMRLALEKGCRKLGIKAVSVLDHALLAIGDWLDQPVRGRPGRQHRMNEEYFNRIEAMHFTLSHDDGQMVEDLDRADIVLVGVSRTSKTPTCMYLANRGYKAANVPLVPTVPLPTAVLGLQNVTVIGLTTSPDRLVQIRRNRLLSLHETDQTDYADPEQVMAEIASAKRLFARQRWPMIDVSRKSIEESAAAILNIHNRRLEELQEIAE